MASIRKRTWRSGGDIKTAWIADYFDQKGDRHIKTFSTKKDATNWLDDTKVEVKRGVHVPASSSITIGEAGAMWIMQSEIDGLERSTVEQYRQHLEQHIKPFIGNVKIADFSPAMAQAFRNDLIQGRGEGQKKRSRAMAKKALSSLGAILANAMSAGTAARNVVREQSRETRRRNRLDKRHEKRLEVGVDIPTKDEIRAMLNHAQGWARPLIVTATFTGLRASELRGLRWADLDLDGAELTVRQRADRWGQIGSPKSDAGKRVVPLAPIVLNALRIWRPSCPKGPLDLVFPNSKGSVRQLSSIHYRGLGPLQVSLDIVEPVTDAQGNSKLQPVLIDGRPALGDDGEPALKPVLRQKYGLHAFRHAAASLFIEQGFSPKRVQALMGHSTIQMTFDTYGHLFPAPEDDKAAMRQLQARLVG